MFPLFSHLPEEIGVAASRFRSPEWGRLPDGVPVPEPGLSSGAAISPTPPPSRWASSSRWRCSATSSGSIRSSIVPVLVESAIYRSTTGSLDRIRDDACARNLAAPCSRRRGLRGATGVRTRIVMSWARVLRGDGVASGHAVCGWWSFSTGCSDSGVWIDLRAGAAALGRALSRRSTISALGDHAARGNSPFRCSPACFGLLFWNRGFAIAVYTHALYDLYVTFSSSSRKQLKERRRHGPAGLRALTSCRRWPLGRGACGGTAGGEPRPDRSATGFRACRLAAWRRSGLTAARPRANGPGRLVRRLWRWRWSSLVVSFAGGGGWVSELGERFFRYQLAGAVLPFLVTFVSDDRPSPSVPSGKPGMSFRLCTSIAGRPRR